MFLLKLSLIQDVLVQDDDDRGKPQGASIEQASQVYLVLAPKLAKLVPSLRNSQSSFRHKDTRKACSATKTFSTLILSLRHS